MKFLIRPKFTQIRPKQVKFGPDSTQNLFIWLLVLDSPKKVWTEVEHVCVFCPFFARGSCSLVSIDMGVK